MPSEFYFTARSSESSATMADADTWDIQQWSTFQKAEQRYSFWQVDGFAKGSIQQMFLAKMVIDLFDMTKTDLIILTKDVHPFKKIVVYNKQPDTIASKATKLGSGIAEGGFSTSTTGLAQIPGEIHNYAQQAASSSQLSSVEWQALYNKFINSAPTGEMD